MGVQKGGKVRHEGGLERCVPVGSTGSAACFLAPGDVGPLQPSSTGRRGIPLQMALTGSSEQSQSPEAYQMWPCPGE